MIGGKRTKGSIKTSQPGIPLVSIITVVFNGKETLEETIRSVNRQLYPNIEYIIIDGNSYDGTQEILKNNSHLIDYWISEPDKGIYDAWNKSLDLVKGEWVAFLGSGDTYKPDAVQNYVQFLKQNEQTHFQYVSSKVALVSKDRKVKRILGNAWSWSKFKRYMNVAHVGSLHHISLFKEYGFYKTDFKIASDYEFLLRSKENLRAGFLDLITAEMLNDGVSLRNNKVFLETYQAKIYTANRNKLLCYYEMILARLKYKIRSLLGF
jgi:glycosyltransferase involved in cell wall biosynthesis